MTTVTGPFRTTCITGKNILMVFSITELKRPGLTILEVRLAVVSEI